MCLGQYILLNDKTCLLVRLSAPQLLVSFLWPQIILPLLSTGEKINGK